MAIAAFDEGPYYRNPIVCVPSKTGRALFWVPGLLVYGTVYTLEGVMIFGTVVLAIPAYPLLWPFGLNDELWDMIDAMDSEDAIIVAEDSWVAVMNIGGLALGTPALPFSYLTGENRCSPTGDRFEPPAIEEDDSEQGDDLGAEPKSD